MTTLNGIPDFALLYYMMEKRQKYVVVRFTDVLGYSKMNSVKEEQCLYFYLGGQVTMGKVVMMSDNEKELRAQGADLQKQTDARYSNDPMHTNNHYAHTSSNVETMTTIVYPLMSEDSKRNKMFILGPNGTTISERLMSRIYWSDCISATCDLLYGIFGDAVLGQQDLDPAKVEDVVYIVTKKCQVEERNVLEAIKRRCSIVRNQMSKRRLREIVDDIIDIELPMLKK